MPRYKPAPLPFARGLWAASTDALGAALRAFAERENAPVGTHNMVFGVLEDPRAQPPCERRWMVGLADYDRETLPTGTPDDPNPTFEGWPYAEIGAREAPGGPLVEIARNAAYADAQRAYLRRLLAALVADGLRIEEAPVAQAFVPKRPRVPRYPAHYRRWRAVWQAVGREANRRTVPDLCRWLQQMHSDLACSEEVLTDIIRAQEAGLLG